MSSYRKARLTFFIGTNGVGKSEAMKKFIKTNERNLIFPSSVIDKAWHDYPYIKPEKLFIEDHKRSMPGKEKQKAVYRLPNLDQLKGTYVVNTANLSDNEIQELFAESTNPITGFSNGGLFVDDFKGMLKSYGVLPTYFKQLMNNMRHMRLDVFMATHGMNEINGQFYMHNPTFYIFKSASPPGTKVKRQYNYYNELVEVYDRVQVKSRDNMYYCEKFYK